MFTLITYDRTCKLRSFMSFLQSVCEGPGCNEGQAMSGPRQNDNQGDCLPETSFVMSECFASARMILQSSR